MENIDDFVKRLKELGAKRVFVQFPEGIKTRMPEIVRRMERAGFEVVLCCEECYGACDIRDSEARELGCDTILHIGHEDFGLKASLPVVFWEYFIDANPVPALVKELGKLEGFKKIGLVTSIQFVKTIPEVKKFLETHGKKVFVHKSLQHDGQVLGCRLEAAETVEKNVDCFLCISAGKFYGLGVVLVTEKPVLCLDLERNEIYSLDSLKKRIQKTVAWNVSQIKDAKRIGLLVSWKKGQFKPNVYDVKNQLEKEGKEVFILAMDRIEPEKFEGLKLNALINFACPRIGIDDLEKYKTPIVNWDQLEKETA